ncbi:hypothetical protein ACP70R_045196 [Stipagrostis hirtigluma subsp. patula]
MALWQTSSIALAAVLFCIAMVVAQAAGTTASKNNAIGGKGNDAPKAESLVVAACRNMSNGFLSTKTHFHEELCVTALRSDSRSAAAKDHGDLAVVALDLLGRRSDEAAAKIDGMLRGLAVHNRTQRAFQFCSAHYASMVRTLPACRDMFLGLKPLGKKAPCFDPVEDDAGDVLRCLDGIGEDASGCDLWLANNWGAEKAEEFGHVIRHISLAWGLVEMATDCLDNDSHW